MPALRSKYMPDIPVALFFLGTHQSSLQWQQPDGIHSKTCKVFLFSTITYQSNIERKITKGTTRKIQHYIAQLQEIYSFEKSMYVQIDGNKHLKGVLHTCKKGRGTVYYTLKANYECCIKEGRKEGEKQSDILHGVDEQSTVSTVSNLNTHIINLRIQYVQMRRTSFLLGG